MTTRAEQVIDEILKRLDDIDGIAPESGFWSQYQSELDCTERKLIVQVRADGPANKAQSQLKLFVFGLVGFSEHSHIYLLALLKAVRQELFVNDDRRKSLGGLIQSGSLVEEAETTFREPHDSQRNAYFAMPLSMKYSELAEQ